MPPLASDGGELPSPRLVESPGRIFVSIVAYCDPELPRTLQALLAHAERPDLLYVAVVWQGSGEPLSEEDLRALTALWGSPKNAASGGDGVKCRLPLPGNRVVHCEESFHGHLRLIRMPAEDARGPCWARYLAQLLWAGEELYLQLDSHMRFVPQWDREMRDQLVFCMKESEKPVLCGYGRGYKLGAPPNWVAPADLSGVLNCAGFFDGDNILNIRYRSLRADWLAPQRSFFWSAHFSFSSAEMLREVPYDPQLPMLFYGEEILMTVRLYTFGWDLFAPSKGLIYHLWERDYRRVYMADMTKLYLELGRASRRRLHHLLGSGPAPFFEECPEAWPLPGDVAPRRHATDPFGLGAVRSLQEYELAADVSFSGRRLGAFALRGGAAGESVFAAEENGDQATVERKCRGTVSG